MNRPLLILTLLMLLLGGSWLLKEHQRERPTTQAIEKYVDYYFKGLQVVRMDRRGLPREQLQSEHMLHLRGEESAALLTPRVQLRDEQGQRWLLRADSGFVYEQDSRVDLHGHVRLARPAGKGLSPLQLESERMRVEPQRGYAESDAPVRISDAHTIIEAVGMRAYIDEQRLELPAQVRGTYDPSTP